MGCCSSNIHSLAYNHRYFNSLSLEEKDFNAYTSNVTPFSINDPITIVDGVTVNPLAFALFYGKIDQFRHIKEILGAKIKQMNLLLEKQNISAFSIIFRFGHLEILQYYLPLYMLECDSKVSSIEELQKPLILDAVRYKHLEVVKFIYFYFKDVEPPLAFNLSSLDDRTGDNAALIACRNCDLQMVTFLHETCNIDFFVTNNLCQNPLMTVGINGTGNPNCYALVKYLLENVGIRTSFSYENIIEEFSDEAVKDLIRKHFLGIDFSFVSESESRISNITIICKKDEDVTLGDLQVLM